MNTSLTITRSKKSSTFVYSDRTTVITDKDFLAWVEKLAIPPAWKNVQISRSKRSKILASGYDAAGRLQSIYSPSFRAQQEKLKFNRMLRFAQALPKIRRQINHDLQKQRLSKDKVIACIVKLIDHTYIRVGNERYATTNQTYGITTMRSKHLGLKGNTVTFDFVGKSGKKHTKQITDSQIARLVKRLDELPGYELFRYQDAHGTLHDINSNDVNSYIKLHMGEEFSAKDFRTWGGTLIATTELVASEHYESKKDRQKMVTSVVKNVAKQLGNTPAIARSSYIDPRVISAYVDTHQIHQLRDAMTKMHPRKYMTRDELCVLRILNLS